MFRFFKIVTEKVATILLFETATSISTVKLDATDHQNKTNKTSQRQVLLYSVLGY